MFAKLCAVDLHPAHFAGGRIAQTSVAEVSAIVVGDDRGEVPAYHLLAHSAEAEYLCDRRTDAVAEFDGRPAGWSSLRGLTRH